MKKTNKSSLKFIDRNIKNNAQSLSYPIRKLQDFKEVEKQDTKQAKLSNSVPTK